MHVAVVAAVHVAAVASVCIAAVCIAVVAFQLLLAAADSPLDPSSLAWLMPLVAVSPPLQALSCLPLLFSAASLFPLFSRDSKCNLFKQHDN